MQTQAPTDDTAGSGSVRSKVVMTELDMESSDEDEDVEEAPVPAATARQPEENTTKRQRRKTVGSQTIRIPLDWLELQVCIVAG